MTRLMVVSALAILANVAAAQRYADSQGRIRVALAKQSFSPNGVSQGPRRHAQPFPAAVFRYSRRAVSSASPTRTTAPIRASVS